MATDKQIAANRLNAQKSTGPKTPEGKKRSSQNRIIHGFRGTETVLADEDYDGYRHLVADLYEEWKPQTATECLQVEIMARSFWHIRRAARMETEHHTARSKTAPAPGSPNTSTSWAATNRAASETSAPPSKLYANSRPTGANTASPSPSRTKISHWINNLRGGAV